MGRASSLIPIAGLCIHEPRRGKSILRQASMTNVFKVGSVSSVMLSLSKHSISTQTYWVKAIKKWLSELSISRDSLFALEHTGHYGTCLVLHISATFGSSRLKQICQVLQLLFL